MRLCKWRFVVQLISTKDVQHFTVNGGSGLKRPYIIVRLIEASKNSCEKMYYARSALDYFRCSCQLRPN